MTKVKVFVYGRRQRQRRQRRGYDNSSSDFRPGELKSVTIRQTDAGQSPGNIKMDKAYQFIHQHIQLTNTPKLRTKQYINANQWKNYLTLLQISFNL